LLRLGFRRCGQGVLQRGAAAACHRALWRAPGGRVRADCRTGGKRPRLRPTKPEPGGHMPRAIIHTTRPAKPPAVYSQAVRAAGLIFVSGTAPHDPQTGALVGTTIQEQTRQCLTNIAAILESAGSSLDKIASVTIVLADEADFQGMNEEYLKWFPSNPP